MKLFWCCAGARTHVQAEKHACVSKVYEKIIYKDLFDHFCNQISKHQFGHCKKKSTVTQLLIHLEYIYKAKDDRSNHFVSTVYVDFEKAFDKVSHRVLLQKLCRLGIQGTLFEILKSYLEDRKQCVRINGQYTDEADVMSGVPQGSILGPFLFVIHVNDIPELFISLCKLFVDDLKIYSISRLDLEEDILRLRRWCIDNGMEVNGIKCGFLLFKGDPDEAFVFSEGCCFKRKYVEKDLGVMVSANLHWTEHWKRCINAYAAFFMIKRNVSSVTTLLAKLNLFKSYLVPILTSGMQVC